MSLAIAKMHGAGNDFVVVATAPPPPPRDASVVRKLADRRRGVGADGVLWMERLEDDEAVFRMHFYNCDGSRVKLCLNGARCVALRAVQLGWAEGRFRFLVEEGQVEAELLSPGAPTDARREVAIWIDPPRATAGRLPLPQWAPASEGHPVDTGDPHLVLEVTPELLDQLDIDSVGPRLRNWKAVFAEGSNVHFVAREGSRWRIRSFERGVEAETQACGSGCLSAVVALERDFGPEEITLQTSGGDVLGVCAEDERWRIRGPASLVFETSFDEQEHAPGR